jgi:hypothetical protein
MRDFPPGFFPFGKLGGSLPLHPLEIVVYRASQSGFFCFASPFFLFSVVVAAATDVFVIRKSGL